MRLSIRIFSENALKVSTGAVQRLKLLSERKPESILRVSVQGGGCQGFEYKFDLDNTKSIKKDEDTIVSKDDARLVVDLESYDLLKGATLDYKSGLIGSEFVIVNNPISDATCGCNRSFNVK